jgi:cyclopropane fatty-acyl-phospholipid synthase-like methyltransferase
MQLLRGTNIYPFAAFYEAKNALMRYSGSPDYINYGFWRDGSRTVDPSRALVELVVSKLFLGADDVVLNIGAGLGQPDVEMVQTYGVKRVIGVNICAEQVAYARAKFNALELSDRIEHRLLDASQIDTLAGEGITRVVCIEAIQEISGIEECITKAVCLLPDGGRMSCCGEVRQPAGSNNVLQRLAGFLAMKITSKIYGEKYRLLETYQGAMRDAGLRNVRAESIGHLVYPYAQIQLQGRLPALFRRRDIPRTVRVLAYLNARIIGALFRWRCIDYVVISGEK